MLFSSLSHLISPFLPKKNLSPQFTRLPSTSPFFHLLPSSSFLPTRPSPSLLSPCRHATPPPTSCDGQKPPVSCYNSSSPPSHFLLSFPFSIHLVSLPQTRRQPPYSDCHATRPLEDSDNGGPVGNINQKSPLLRGNCPHIPPLLHLVVLC